MFFSHQPSHEHSTKQQIIFLLGAPFPSGQIDVILKSNDEMGSLLLSGVEATQNLQLLEQHNVQAILTVGQELTNIKFPSNSIEGHLIIRIQDQADQNISVHFKQACEFIEEQRKKKRNVLVHCYVGVSRSATLVIVYLMQKYNLGFEQAFLECQKQRPYINPNQGFINQMQRYDQQRQAKKQQVQQDQLSSTSKKSDPLQQKQQPQQLNQQPQLQKQTNSQPQPQPQNQLKHQQYHQLQLQQHMLEKQHILEQQSRFQSLQRNSVAQYQSLDRFKDKENTNHRQSNPMFHSINTSQFRSPPPKQYVPNTPGRDPLATVNTMRQSNGFPRKPSMGPPPARIPLKMSFQTPQKMFYPQNIGLLQNINQMSQTTFGTRQPNVPVRPMRILTK